MLAGCSPAVHLELLNETSGTILAEDFARRSVTIAAGRSEVLDLPGRYLKVEMPGKQCFDLRRPPSEYVHTTRRGLVIYAIIDKEGLLYLGQKAGDGKIRRIDPQPKGFPLKGQTTDDEIKIKL